MVEKMIREGQQLLHDIYYLKRLVMSAVNLLSALEVEPDEFGSINEELTAQCKPETKVTIAKLVHKDLDELLKVKEKEFWELK